MQKLGGTGLVSIGAMILFLGLVFQWERFQDLFDITGIIMMVIGAIIGIIGLIQMFSGGKESSSDF